MKFCIDSMYGAGGTILADIFARIGVDHVADPVQSRSAVSGHQPRAHRAAHPRAGRGHGGQPLPCRPVHRWRRRPHRRHRRARQLRRPAQDLLGAAELGAEAQGLARRGDARVEHDKNARPHLQEARPRAYRARHRFQVCLRPHAGARDRDGRRGVGRHRLPAPPAGARRPAERAAASPM